jgi:apolipoprotein N-acyltransferase
MAASSVVWLALGGVLELFGPGRWKVPAAPWLVFLFLLRFSRSQQLLPGCLAIWLVMSLAIGIANRGVIKVPGVGYLAVVLLIGAMLTLPFIVDRLLGPGLPGVASTLVFPLAYIATEWINGQVSPFGTWGAMAYTQSGNLPLMQAASVTGIWSLTFLITWFGSVGEWAWARGFEWVAVRPGMLAYGAVLGLVLLAGGLRLALSPRSVPTVRVAGIGWPSAVLDRKLIYQVLLDDSLSSSSIDQARQAFERVIRSQLDASRREAQAGARLIVWTETSAPVLEADREALMEEVRAFAREAKVYLLLGVAVLRREGPQPRADNEAWLVTPEGDVAFTYRKAHDLPPDLALTRLGEKRIPTFDSALGRIAGAVCFDLEYPGYIRQAGLAGADLLLAPYGDWEAIKQLQAEMAAFRAVENGVTLIRPARGGLSTAVDPYGRTLASMDEYSAEQRTMVAQVPTAGLRTLYARLGDWFAWACCTGLVAMAAWVVLRSVRGA